MTEKLAPVPNFSVLPTGFIRTKLSLVLVAPERWCRYPDAVRGASMATVVNIHEAKTHLSKFVDEAAAGREVIIAKAGRKIARLVPIEVKPRPKKLGGLKGRIKVPDDFNTPLESSVIAAFEGRS